MTVLAKFRYYLTLLLYIFTVISTPAAVSSESAKLISTDTVVFEQAFITGQGITTDGEYFYTSGAITALNLTALGKFSVDSMEFVDQNINPLPKECSDRGNNHIGGISYYNGKIYASVEGGEEVPSCVVVFDAQTLEATGEVYNLPVEKFESGVPWCAVDGETGLLYASVWENTKTIHVYDVNNSMEYVRSISLNGYGAIKRIQGGEFLDGTLYLSQDTKESSIKNIFAVDTESGEVTVVAERNVGSDNIEAEGMTFTRTENGTVLHVLDYNRVIGVSVHHYEF